MTLKITFLGTGTSHGVPMIGCDCAVCSSTDPRNQRLRSSALVEWDGRALLIDTATELRLQARRADLRRVDAILLTHSHADHILGMDDVRRFNDLQRASIPCFGSPATLDNLRRQFPYVFTGPAIGGGKPRIEPVPVEAGVPFAVLGLDVVPIPVSHGGLEILAYRFGPLAYVTDVSEIPRSSLPLLEGLDLLVLDALRWKPHPTHFSVAQALEVVERLRPRRTLFTHIAHDLDHAATEAQLPPHVGLAYDGLIVDLDAEPVGSNGASQAGHGAPTLGPG